MIDDIVSVMSRYGRILTPTHQDWELAATLIARRIRLKGSMKPWDHFGDALITASAARIKGVVATQNVDDFETWTGLAKSSGLDIIVRCYEP